MWRVVTGIIWALFALSYTASAESLRVTTWNLEWFPSGIANLRDPAKEAKRIAEAAGVLKALNPDVILIQEVRDWESCERLAAAIDSAYQVIVCSAFPERVGGAPGWQQEAIIARRPAQATWSEAWKTQGLVDPPRGFAFAAFKLGTTDVGFYCVHLKSNLVRGNREREQQVNILKRELAADQLVKHVADLQGRVMPSIEAVVVGGDFNTNHDEELFVSENTLSCLAGAGFRNSFPDGMPLSQRVTHPARGGYPDTTFDYVFAKKAAIKGVRITPSGVSDHFPVTCDIEVIGLCRVANSATAFPGFRLLGDHRATEALTRWCVECGLWPLNAFMN